MPWYNATALYGKGFNATPAPDTFVLRVYTGGFAGRKTATMRAVKEARLFGAEQGYRDHEILAARRLWYPISCVDFHIRFVR